MRPQNSHAAPRRRWLMFALVHLVLILLILGAFAWRDLIDRIPPRPNGTRFSGCILHDLVHVYCPLCGGTRAMVALCQGQLLTSLLCNPVTAYLAVGFIVFDVIAAARIVRHSPLPLVRIPKWYVIGVIALAALVFIIRNALMIGYGIDNLDGLAHYW